MNITDPVDTLWFTRCPAPTAATIAIWRGMLADEFAKDGIAVRSLSSSRNKEVQLSHYYHTQPNSFRFGGYVPPLVNLSRNTDIRIIGLGLPDRMAGIFALPNSPIRTGTDLKGKRLAVPRRLNDSLDWWRATVLAGYDQALKSVGLTFADVELVDVNISRAYFDDAKVADDDSSLWGAKSQFAVQREEVVALMRGEVDVLYSDAALGALLISFLGVHCVLRLNGCAIDDDEDPYPYCLILTVSGALLERRPDLVVRWIVTLLKAGNWAEREEAEAKRLIARDTGLPEDFVGLGYSDRVHRQLDVSLDQRRVRFLQQKCDLLNRHGFLERPVEVAQFIDHRPLLAAAAIVSMSP